MTLDSDQEGRLGDHYRNDLHMYDSVGAYTHDTGSLQGRRLGDHHRQE